MKHSIILQTFFSRFLILALNLGLVVLSTNFWGSEGRGIISIIIADLAIVGFFSNIFVGSGVSYFASKYKTEQILLYAYIWSLIVGVLVPLVFSFFTNHIQDFLVYLILLSISFSLLTAHINLYVGKQSIAKYNIYSFLQQLVHFFLILVFIYIFKLKNVETYFIAQIFCYFILFLISSFDVLKNTKISHFTFSENSRNSFFTYGWKTQLSAFIQFLNYRLSYYFLEFFRGISSVGVFSIGMSISEAVWTISRSLSVILYADVVNSDNAEKSILKTKFAIKISFLITTLFLLVILIFPDNFYSFIFGKDFHDTKEIILLLSPGILAISVSNIIGFYFAGINKLKILNIKSIVGLVITVVLSYTLIPKYGIKGASIVATISYMASSFILFFRFYQITDFSMSDFLITKNEFQKLKNILVKKYQTTEKI